MADAKGLSSIDVAALARELNGYAGGYARKAYQHGKELMLEFYSAEKRSAWLYFDGQKAFLSASKGASSEASTGNPTGFAMAVRKYLCGKLGSVRQVGFDRVMEIKAGEATLFLEFLRPGNAILCSTDGKIILPMEFQRWKDRAVVPKENYLPPPREFNALDFGQFSRAARASEKKAVAWLAMGAGLGKVYANELCERAGIEKAKPAAELSLEEKAELHKELGKMLAQDQAMVYPDMATPFPLEGKAGKPAVSFSKALEEFYSKPFEQLARENREERDARIREKQEKAKERLAMKAAEETDTANLIYTNYSEVDSLLRDIDSLVSRKIKWERIKQELEGKGIVKQILENQGLVIVSLGGQEVRLDFTKDIAQNAVMHFEGSKKARKKLERVMEVSAKETPGKAGQPAKETAVATDKNWYARYKWFVTSDGMPVVTGKDAEQNEELVKKHAEEGDLVFHADIQGAGFTVIKANGKTISEAAKKEAAAFAGANSKAWQKGLGIIDVYAISPAQLSKTARSGESVGKGAFIVTGKREWFKPEVRLCIGLRLKESSVEILSGPEDAVKAYAQYYARIRPGSERPPALAKKVKSYLLNVAGKDAERVQAIKSSEFERFLLGTGEIEV